MVNDLEFRLTKFIKLFSKIINISNLTAKTMKQAFFSLMFALFVHQINAQEQISKSFKIIEIDSNFNISKLYNKLTGKKISGKEFNEIVKNNPNLPLEKIYDKRGNISKYYYDPNIKNSNHQDTDNKSIKIGEPFPDLIIKTVKNQEIKLSNLKGKLIILRFELFADNFRFKKHEIVDIDDQINESNRKSEIEAIIIFTTPKEEINRGFDLENSNFKLVANGRNYHNKLYINNYPSTIVIDKEGILIDIYTYPDEINILELLKE